MVVTYKLQMSSKSRRKQIQNFKDVEGSEWVKSILKNTKNTISMQGQEIFKLL